MRRCRSARYGSPRHTSRRATGSAPRKPVRRSAPPPRAPRPRVPADRRPQVLEDGELFITGRLKDLIIVRGAQPLPLRTSSGPSRGAPIRPGGVAAFSVDGAAEEQVVVVAEVAGVEDPSLKSRQPGLAPPRPKPTKSASPASAWPSPTRSRRRPAEDPAQPARRLLLDGELSLRRTWKLSSAGGDLALLAAGNPEV